MEGPLFDDDFMNDMLLNPDLYGLDDSMKDPYGNDIEDCDEEDDEDDEDD